MSAYDVSSLPTGDGTPKVLFKDEGTEGRQTIGPVYVWFGQRVSHLGWQTRADAKRIAKHYKVPLEEA